MKNTKRRVKSPHVSVRLKAQVFVMIPDIKYSIIKYANSFPKTSQLISDTPQKRISKPDEGFC